MEGLQRSDVVFYHTAEPHDFDRVGAQDLLAMVAISDEKEDAGEENNDHDSGGGPREQFDVEVLLAEQPGETTADKRSGAPLAPGILLCGVRL